VQRIHLEGGHFLTLENIYLLNG